MVSHQLNNDWTHGSLTPLKALSAVDCSDGYNVSGRARITLEPGMRKRAGEPDQFSDPRFADRVAANTMETDLRSGEDAVQTGSPRTEAICMLRQIP